ncbi:hypothetical protein AWB76_04877 [Caballeronia temeraria]|uniref:Uncharacterized protein n=1 Tax=Caballeronia temeraria TaxID=1777137 RepID=A0A158BYS6_9BURK|nr:hypothetical protein AWB76_04877 [Caballeronia temeraria]
MASIRTVLSKSGLGLKLSGWRYCRPLHTRMDALNDKQIQGARRHTTRNSWKDEILS